MDISVSYTSSIFQDLEKYLRTKVDLVEDESGLVLDEHKSKFVTYEIPPGVYIFKYLSEVHVRNVQSEYEGVNQTVDIEHDDISMKTKLVVRPGIMAIKFDKKNIFQLSPWIHSSLG